MRGLPLVAASGGHSSSRCAGLSLSRPLPLRSTGSRCAGSVIVAHGPICSAACGIFPDQGSNPCPLHWQAGSQPLRHQGSPITTTLCAQLSYANGGGREPSTFCAQDHVYPFFLSLNQVVRPYPSQLVAKKKQSGGPTLCCYCLTPPSVHILPDFFFFFF